MPSIPGNSGTDKTAPLDSLHDAIRRDPASETAWLALAAWIHTQQGAHAAARALEKAISIVRDPAIVLDTIARLLAATPSDPLRISALNRLAALRPDNPHVLASLARALLDTAAASAARKPLREAIRLGAVADDLKLALASLESASGEITTADALYSEVLADQPSNTIAWCGRYFNALQELRWSDAAVAADQARHHISEQKSVRGIPNHQVLMLYGNQPPAPLPGDAFVPPPQPRRVPNNRPVRLGYLSSDLHTHATAILAAGLFEAHDRDRFDIFAYSYGPRATDSYRQRIQKATEHWCDLNDLHDAAAARRISADQLDLLIELKGHTQGGRLGITARRPAPIQIHYLGYPGPIGGYGIDYFLADWDTVPEGGEAEFPETVLRLPRCYQVNDARRAPPERTEKSDHGFNEDQVVLANFNQSWKLGEPFVAVWCRALAQNQFARLWLLDPGAIGQREILRCASMHGVDAPEHKIRFATRTDPRNHINRLAVADLALDQLPCASHTTAADALWAGVPMLTMYGNRFAGRVGAALVREIGEDEFIARDLKHYEVLLNSLIKDRQRLSNAKHRLNAKRSTASLWDTGGFTRDMETTLLNLVQRM